MALGSATSISAGPRPLDVDHGNLDIVLARIEAAGRPALLMLWASRWEKKVPTCLSLEKLRRLISDNQTRKYDDLDERAREILECSAWGAVDKCQIDKLVEI